MRFARTVFLIAAIWGVLIVTPLFFLFDKIGQDDPPPITHPGFYFGFVTVTLAWQAAFFVISRDPVRLRPLMIPSMLEKFGYAIAVVLLVLKAQMKPPDLVLAGVDALLGILFVAAFVKTKALQR